MSSEERFKKEIEIFQGMWKGGFSEGDPLDPMGTSRYGFLGYMSVLHVVYLACIRPYVNKGSCVLEIGPGRGCWTKTMLGAKEVWCLDALSAEHNGFWEHVGKAPHVRYFQVKDLRCGELPDDRFTYFFSFATFCHLSTEAFTEYMKNIFPKLKKGCDGFIMAADYKKYNDCFGDLERVSAFRVMDLVNPGRKYASLFWRTLKKYFEKKAYWKTRRQDTQEDNVPRQGRWYNIGTSNACRILRSLGYDVVDEDTGVLNRDPVIHFRKP